MKNEGFRYLIFPDLALSERDQGGHQGDIYVHLDLSSAPAGNEKHVPPPPPPPACRPNHKEQQREDKLGFC